MDFSCTFGIYQDMLKVVTVHRLIKFFKYAQDCLLMFYINVVRELRPLNQV